MTGAEREVARLLAACRFTPGSWDKRFARGMGARALDPSAPPLTERQRESPWRAAHRYRRQLFRGGEGLSAERVRGHFEGRRRAMTEAEWLASDDPQAMLNWALTDGGPEEDHLPLPPSARKLGLIRDAWDSPLCGDERYTMGGITLYSGAAGECYDVLKNVMKRFRPAAANLLRDVVGNPFRPLGSTYGMYRSTVITGPCGRTVLEFGTGDDIAGLAHAAYDERLEDGTLDPARLAVLADALLDAGCAEETLLRHLRGGEACPCRQEIVGSWANVPDDRITLYGEAYSVRKRCRLCDETGRLKARHVRGCHIIDLLLGRD